MAYTGRLEKVLMRNESLLEGKIENTDYDKFVTLVLEEYNKLMQKKDSYTINEAYLKWIMPVISIYKVLLNNFKMKKEDIISYIYDITYESSEEFLQSLSFVQMAYYLICNKPYLRQLILSSLAEFYVEEMKDHIEEIEVDETLQADFEHSKLNDYFKSLGVPNINEIVNYMDDIIPQFVDSHFTKKQKMLTLEEIY